MSLARPPHAQDPLHLDEAMIAAVVDRFYARCRADDLVGPVFNGAVGDWPEHLEKIAAFWSSVMLRTGRYHGRPMPAHLQHRAIMTPAMFDRWLALWTETTSELLPPAVAGAMQTRANMIAESFKLALFFRPEAPSELA